MILLTRRCYLLKIRGQVIIHMKYVKKQTNNMYVNKQTTAQFILTILSYDDEI